MRLGDRGIAALLGGATLVAYLVLIVGNATRFNYFGMLANAIWKGRLWIDGAPLSEIEKGIDGHFYNVQPPLPALLALPFVPFGRADQIEVFVSALFGALSIVPLYLALRALTIPRELAVWCSLLSVFGTTLLYTSVDGRSWFAAHATAVFFTSLALMLAAQRRSPLLIGAALGAAALGRTAVVLAAPGLLLLARQDPTTLRELPRAALLLALGGFPFAWVQGVYDLIRWGNPLNIYGPQLHQEDDPMLARGFMSLTYIPRKIYAIVFEAPRYVDNHVFFLRPRGYGTSLLFTTPAFVWVIPALARLRDQRWFAVALSGGLVALPGVLFATVGYEQFGYRYSLDLQPFLIVLTAVGAGWAGDRWAPASRLFKGFVIVSIALCAYYLATIRLFGFAP